MQNLTCPRCGQQSQSGASTCSNCGTLLNPQFAPVPSATVIYAQPVQKRALPPVVLVGAGFLAGVLFLLGSQAITKVGDTVALPPAANSARPSAPVQPLASTPAPVPSVQRWPVTDGASVPLGVQFRRCLVTGITIRSDGTSHDVDGNITGYGYRVVLAVQNNTSTPKGPRVRVTLWDASGSQSTNGDVAYSLAGDLNPWEQKTFDDYVTTRFPAAYFSISEQE